MEYTISGRYQSRGGWSTFEKDVEAPNEDVARDRAYALLGSHHGLKRTQVELEAVDA
jgi:large subunit ribosomal protein LX